jgi:hypothetical protein
VPLPPLTPEQRQAALEKAAAARRVRAQVKERLRAGGAEVLAEVLITGQQDDAVGKLRVAALLEAMPGVGKVRAARLMDDCEISPTRRVRGLGSKQRAALQAAFPPRSNGHRPEGHRPEAAPTLLGDGSG